MARIVNFILCCFEFFLGNTELFTQFPEMRLSSSRNAAFALVQRTGFIPLAEHPLPQRTTQANEKQTAPTIHNVTKAAARARGLQAHVGRVPRPGVVDS